MNEKTKIFIADDHQIVIDAIQSEIQSQSEDFEVIGFAHNGKEVLESIKNKAIDILILDISMPNINGVEVLKVISDNYPTIKVLVFTMHDDFKHIREMYRLGAKGYIIKNKGAKYVIEALSKIRDGKIFIPPDVANITALDLIPNEEKKKQSDIENIVKSIRDHEAQLLELLTLELTNKELADRMCKSVRTIETWKKNLMTKVGVKSAVGLVRFAIEHGFVLKK